MWCFEMPLPNMWLLTVVNFLFYFEFIFKSAFSTCRWIILGKTFVYVHRNVFS